MARAIAGVSLVFVLGSCGGGGGTTAEAPSQPVAIETISGKVIDGYVARALVCIDLNLNGSCDASEPQTLTDAGGVYQLSVPVTADLAAPLVAQVTAGQSTDANQPAGAIDASYRMASPSRSYSTAITPFTTLVRLSGQSNYPLAEDMARNALGLPSKFDIKLDSPPSAGSTTQGAARAVVSALKALGPNLDLSATASMAPVIAKLPAAFASLPVLRISTQDAAPIVSKEDYINATFSLANPIAGPDAVPLSGKIRGRGNSTWGQPKNPYKIQFANDASYAAIPDFLGMKKNRNWALLADYFDRSLMRNKLALSLGSSSVFSDGLKWSPTGQHVEVYLNDDYVGVYLLTEDIRIDPARLAIKKMGSGDLDGGYIAEVDFRLDCYRGAGLDLGMVTARNVPICVDTPDEADITTAQLAYIKGALADAESDLYGTAGARRINLQSFVDWYLLNELFRNADAAFVSSVFMWKDSASAANALDRLVNMGPLWDFDRSAGNLNYYDGWMTEGCHVNHPTLDVFNQLARPEAGNWLAALSQNPEFVSLVVARWKQKRPALATLINSSVDTYASRLDAAQQRNFKRWPVLGQQMTNYYVFTTYAQEVDFVRRFLNDRMVWLDKAYASTDSFNAMCK